MRDSNYSFPAQNRVCVSITAQLYDRRALDTSSMLPLLNSLTHLTYLTSTSPRIRDILIIDGGLERLLEILKESALPRPPVSPIPDWYALRGSSTASILSLQQQISLRHSLAFQCVVNIGVRGSEMVRTRVVQSGTLDVVAQIMEVWLKGKGMSILSGPLGSQAAVDRAAAGIAAPWNPNKERSKDKHRDREREREREKSREKNRQGEGEGASTGEGDENMSGVERGDDVDAASRGTPPPFPEHRNPNPAAPTPNPTATTAAEQTRQTFSSLAHHTLPTGRIVTRDSLERSLTPQDEPTPNEIITNMLTMEQRAAITRINAVARLAVIDRSGLRRAALTDSPQSNALRNLFRGFNLDLNVLLALEGGNLSPTGAVGGRVAGGEGAGSGAGHSGMSHSGRRRSALNGRGPVSPPRGREVQQPEQGNGNTEDVAMQSADEDGDGTVPGGRDLIRRGTITMANRTGVPPPRQSQIQAEGPSSIQTNIESPTPRAFATTLPTISVGGSGINVRPRPARGASSDTTMQTLAEEGETRFTESGSSSTSAVSSLNDESRHPTAGPGPSSLSASRPQQPPAFARRSSSRAIFETSSINSAASTPTVDTPPPPTVMRNRSGTITANRFAQPPVEAIADERSRTLTPLQNDGDRAASRAGTEDEESAVGEAPAQLADGDVGIVGTTDDEAVEALSGLVEVDADAQAQAEMDLAMGAPPGAPGAAQTPRIPEMTPRQALRQAPLPAANIAGTPGGNRDRYEAPAFAAVIAAGAPRGFSDLSDLVNVIETTTSNGETTYSDDTILLCLQLLAYLSKYPHVRAAFHHPRRPMHPDCDIPEEAILPERPALSQSNNMFALVERFTFRPSGPDPEMQKLPADIQYWAGVIMRNACRKDEAHGGIRQCANTSCGKWETFPREFAKCRRCRKAKYCSKECQSKAWQEGHRFWCNARDPEPGEAGITGTVIIPGARHHSSDHARRQRRRERHAEAAAAQAAQAMQQTGGGSAGGDGGNSEAMDIDRAESIPPHRANNDAMDIEPAERAPSRTRTTSGGGVRGWQG